MLANLFSFPQETISLGFAIRDQMNSISEAPGKTWFWELADAVIDAGRCVQCGVCVAACPSDSIGVSEAGLPKLVKMCTGCSLCWDFCPRGGLRYEATWRESAQVQSSEVKDPQISKVSLGRRSKTTPNKITPTNVTALGVLEKGYAARVPTRIEGAQDGGVVSQILIALLEAGEIDGALLAKQSSTQSWKAEPYLAQTPQDVRTSAGSYYNQTMALGHLDLSKYDLPKNPRIAMVGTPCEIQGIKALQATRWSRGRSLVDSIGLTIALLCTKSFDYEKLILGELKQKRGIDPSEIGRIDVIYGKLIVDSVKGSTLVAEPIKNFHGAALRGCDECADFLGRASDISVGSVGSVAGWSSVLVRTEQGMRAFEKAWPKLQVRDLDNTQALEKLDALDKKIAFNALQREFDPDGPLFIEFEDHLENYMDSDRQVVGSSQRSRKEAV